MARFDPFPALRYADPALLVDVAVPPYDVIDDEERARLVARHERSAVRVDLPVDEGGTDRYEVARRLLDEWRADGTLTQDRAPTFTVHRMTYCDDAGKERHTTGVVGALELTAPGTDILPHEQTTPKAKSDRLDLLRSTRANLSAIWGLSLAKGLTDLLPTGPAPDADFVDDNGVRHSLWVIADQATMAEISAAVAGAPVVIADGHHRFETSLTYRAEREAAEGDAGSAAATMAYLVELVEDELEVQAIHRLLARLPDGFDLEAALMPWFASAGPPPSDRPITETMVAEGALTLVLDDRELLLQPRPEALPAACVAGERDESAISTRAGSTWPWPRSLTTTSRSSTGSTTSAGRSLRARPRQVCCCGRQRSPRSRRPRTAASACPPRRRSSIPSPRAAWCSGCWTEPDAAWSCRVGWTRPQGVGRNAPQDRPEGGSADRRPLSAGRSPAPTNSSGKVSFPLESYSTSQVAPERSRLCRSPGPLASTAWAIWALTLSPYSGRSTARNTPIGVGS